MLGKGKMEIISERARNIQGMERFRSLIGKKAVSKSGDRVGKVHDVVFKGSSLEGIVIRRWLSKMFLGIEFVGSTSDDSVMLLIDPVNMLVGKQVFDADGKKLGKVVSVIRPGSSNSFIAVAVKRRFYSRRIEIPKKDIKVSKRNLILGKVYR